MPRIAWVEDEDARDGLAETFAGIRARHPTGQVPPILRTLSARPDFLATVDRAANDRGRSGSESSR